MGLWKRKLELSKCYVKIRNISGFRRDTERGIYMKEWGELVRERKYIFFYWQMLIASIIVSFC